MRGAANVKSILFMGDEIQAIYLGRGVTSYYVASLDVDFESLDEAKAAIRGLNEQGVEL